MLLGTYTAKFAPGRRIAVPAIFRTQLGQSYIIAKWYENCLVLIDKDSWGALYKRLTGGESQSLLVTPIRNTERFILSSAFEVLADEQGRIVIPEILSNYASLEEEVIFLGLGERIEIWNLKRWYEKEVEVSSKAASFIEELSK